VEEVREKVEDKIDFYREKVMQKIATYKKLVETRDKIKRESFSYDSITAEDVGSSCGMQCVQFCFQDERYRFENVLDIYKICLVPLCNCTSGEVTYQK